MSIEWDFYSELLTIIDNVIGEINTMYNSSVSSISGLLTSTMAYIQTYINAINTIFGELIATVDIQKTRIISTLDSWGKTIYNYIRSVPNIIRSAVSGIYDSIDNMINQNEDDEGSWYDSYIGTLKDFIGNILTNIKDWFNGFYSGKEVENEGFIDKLKASMNNFYHNVINLYLDVTSGIMETFNMIVEFWARAISSQFERFGIYLWEFWENYSDTLMPSVEDTKDYLVDGIMEYTKRQEAKNIEKVKEFCKEVM